MKKYSKWLAFGALVLGLFLSTNVIYVFYVGNTPFLISSVYSAILFGVFLVTRQIDWNRIVRTFQNSFIFFCVWILLSAIFALITFMNISLMYRYIVGVISFFISFTAMIDAMVLYQYRKHIGKGIALGIVINGIVCIIQYVYYHSGKSFDFLYSLFPQDSFHKNIYNFMTQGLFLEPSHMNQFLATGVTLWLGMNWEGKFKDYFVLACALISSTMSTSGTSMVIYIGIVLFFVIYKPLRRYASRKAVLFVAVMIPLTMVCLLLIANSGMLDEVFGNLEDYLNLAFSGSSIADESNEERVLSITTALSLLPQVPIGCGWNMVHTLLEGTSLRTPSAFSDIIEMLLELGIIGVSFYIFLYLKMINKCWKKGGKEATGIGVSLLLTLIIATLADYAINPCIMVLLGTAMCHVKDDAHDATFA